MGGTTAALSAGPGRRLTVEAYFTGLGLGFSLIVAIGAQNAFVLRQGLRREHVFPVCLVCGLSDAVLIFFGVSGFEAVSSRFGWLEPALRYGGAAFLGWYGCRSLRSALHSRAALTAAAPNGRFSDDQTAKDGQVPPAMGPGPSALAGASLARTLSLCLALTWLNPHVYLDTVVMMGTLSAGFPGAESRFAAGAVSASFIFFFTLGYGAGLLRPLFADPRAWRILEAAIAALMWGIALKLLWGL